MSLQNGKSIRNDFEVRRMGTPIPAVLSTDCIILDKEPPVEAFLIPASDGMTHRLLCVTP